MTTTRSKHSNLVSPYGGRLKSLVADPDEVLDLRQYAESLPSISLSERTTCDLELLATGAFSPLDRFISSVDYRSVLDNMRLENGTLFPIPVTLPLPHDTAVKENSDVALCDQKNNLLAILTVEEVYKWDRQEYAEQVLGTTSLRHPIVLEIQSWGERFVSGRVRVFQLPQRFDFADLRMTPTQVRARLDLLGASDVVAFQTRNPLHRAHEEMARRAMEQTGGVLLIQPVVGLTRPGDIDHYSRVRTYKALTEKYYDRTRVLLSLLPLAMRLAGPREAVWHALIRRNYGANHFIVGRDHASPGVDENGKSFYEPHSAIDLAWSCSGELGVEIISFDELVYLPSTGQYEERTRIDPETEFVPLSGSEIRRGFLDTGKPIPEWYMRPEVAEILHGSQRARHQQGFCIWFTGLSGSGKSTTAEILAELLASHGRRVTLLDGDVVRTHLSAGLGFDRTGRDANIRRIGFVASEVVRHGGVAICAAISPYHETRNEVRKMIGENFIEIFVDTPLKVCETRDQKGMYAKARRGEIKDFTGVDDVYEKPELPELTIGTVGVTAVENAHLILQLLNDAGLIQVK